MQHTLQFFSLQPEDVWRFTKSTTNGNAMTLLLRAFSSFLPILSVLSHWLGRLQISQHRMTHRTNHAVLYQLACVLCDVAYLMINRSLEMLQFFFSYSLGEMRNAYSRTRLEFLFCCVWATEVSCEKLTRSRSLFGSEKKLLKVSWKRTKRKLPLSIFFSWQNFWKRCHLKVVK